MKFEYTGRHVEVTPAIRRHVEEHFHKIEHIFDDAAASIHVIIDVEKNRQTGEVLVHWRDHTLTASDTNSDMYQALTRAIDKVETQAVKLKKKIVGRRRVGRSAAGGAAPVDGEEVGAAPLPARIIQAQNYQVKPMTAEEAALSLRDDANQFIVFRDADTNRVGVLYKRKDGNFGLVEP
ncbi:MAG: ribosome-associated translation inhibitor RaiA [Pyrinomonadaceae bacterium]